MQDKKEQLIKKLEEIFQFPNEDLDFGIYKVYKYKRDYIKKFLYGSDDENIKSIDQIINQAFRELESINLSRLEIKLKEIEKEVIETFGEKNLNNVELLSQTPKGKEYLALKEQYKRQKEKSELSEEIKINIYNHLYNFFSKYYKDGDFIPLRRWGNDRHIVFYNGQEVFFYWSTKDMYYIKSGEIFKEYSFKVDNKVKVIFKVIEVQDTKGNQKSNEKRFFFFKNVEKESLDKIIIYFEYGALKEEEKEKYGKGDKVQANINEETKKKLEEKLRKDFPLLFKKENDEEIIFKHLRKFTHKNRFDFFIHKNLKEFLLTELDFYIKNSVLHFENLDDFDEFFSNTKFYVKEAQVIYKIAKQIIEFLSILENFQKRLWEKPKFVIDTHYVITLDRLKSFLSEDRFNEFLSNILSNENQKQEWVNLGFFESVSDIIKESLYNEDGSLKPLPVDTKNFGEEFKWELLNALSENEDFNLDEALDGILIKSDNYQALNLLRHKFRNSIKTVYIDPPYNTGNDGFLYKDSYRHSSWLSMMENRLELARELMSEDGAIFVSIDDNEVDNLKKVMSGVFGEENFVGNFIWQSKGGSGTDARYLSIETEYLLMYSKFLGKLAVNRYTYDTSDYNLKDEYFEERGYYKLNKLDRKSLGYIPSLDFPITVDGLTAIPGGTEEENKKKVWRWRWSKEKVEWGIKNGFIVLKKDEKTGVVKAYYKIYEKVDNEGKPIDRSRPYNNIIPEGITTSSGTYTIESMFNLRLFEYPKPIELAIHLLKISSKENSYILDFFAGSGTTAHAVMKLNAEDGGKRKFILVEMADYFDTVIIPRIKKVAYSFDWKEGKPQNTNGKGIFFKYHTLEQYEDSLENINFSDVNAKLQTNNPLEQKLINLQPNHIIQYKLDIQTQKLLDIQNFEDIQNYKIKILDTKNTQKADYKTVDIIETFIYLSGIKVEKIIKINEYTLIIGTQNNLKTLAIFQHKTDKPIDQIAEQINQLINTHNPDQIYINNTAKTPILNKEIQVKSIENLFMEKMS